MCQLPIFILALLLLTAGIHSHSSHGDYHHDHDTRSLIIGESSTLMQNGNKCGFIPPTLEEQRIDNDIVQKWIADNKNVLRHNKAAASVKVSTYFHLITNRSKGNKTDEEIIAQLPVLNEGFQGSGFSFVLAGITRTSNAKWYSSISSSITNRLVEWEMKRALHEGNAATLNVYLTDIPNYGFAYLPSYYYSNTVIDGVVIDTETIPGGTIQNYNQGKTLTHEVGHWLGLLHTFYEGEVASVSCIDADYVEDTPAQQSPTEGCPIGRDSCPNKPGLDPIHNFMDYSYDICYYEFTPGQIIRMKALWDQYRSPCKKFKTQRVCERKKCHWQQSNKCGSF